MPRSFQSCSCLYWKTHCPSRRAPTCRMSSSGSSVDSSPTLLCKSSQYLNLTLYSGDSSVYYNGHHIHDVTELIFDFDLVNYCRISEQITRGEWYLGWWRHFSYKEVWRDWKGGQYVPFVIQEKRIMLVCQAGKGLQITVSTSVANAQIVLVVCQTCLLYIMYHDLLDRKYKWSLTLSPWQPPKNTSWTSVVSEVSGLGS